VGQKIEPRYIDIGLQKTWSPAVPQDAAAKFILKRYKQTEYIDYQSVKDNPDILVQLQDSQGNVLSHVYTKSGLPMYIDATFAPGKTGTFSFEYGGHTYTVLNQTVSESSVALRSDPITVTGNSGDTVVVTMTAGDLENLAEGTAYNLRITDRHLNNDLTLDSEVREVTFPIEGKTGAEAWQYTFEDLPVEEGVWNSAGDYANMTIYSYYLEEDPDGTTGGYVPEIKDSAGNVISSTNRIYNSDTITVTNLEEPGITVTVRKVAKADVNNASAATLPGATFKLVKYTSSSYQQIDSSFEAVTIADNDNTISGVFTFNGLKEGYYQLEETVCPEGYVRTTSNPRFRVTTESGETVARLVNDNGTDIDSNASEMVVVENAESNHIVTVGNEPGAALPSTGGPGTRLFTILGSMLSLGAGLLLWRRRRTI
jgi:LPXTG-motif cell wall-anchored protein